MNQYPHYSNPYNPSTPRLVYSPAPGYSPHTPQFPYNPASPYAPAQGPSWSPNEPPPPLPPPPKKRSAARLITIVILLVLLILGSAIIGGVVFLHKFTATVQATATAQKLSYQQTQATFTYPFSANLVLNDPLTDPGHVLQYGWDHDLSQGCGFAKGAYQVTGPKGYYDSCVAEKTNFTDFTFQADFTIEQGSAKTQMGLIFRANASKGTWYMFGVDERGLYALDIASLNSKNQLDTQNLMVGQADQFHSGAGHTNMLAVVVRGDNIDVYVNNEELIGASDSTYPGGQVGFIINSVDTASTVAVTNAKVWQL